MIGSLLSRQWLLVTIIMILFLWMGFLSQMFKKIIPKSYKIVHQLWCQYVDIFAWKSLLFGGYIPIIKWYEFQRHSTVRIIHTIPWTNSYSLLNPNFQTLRIQRIILLYILRNVFRHLLNSPFLRWTFFYIMRKFIFKSDGKVHNILVWVGTHIELVK